MPKINCKRCGRGVNVGFEYFDLHKDGKYLCYNCKHITKKNVFMLPDFRQLKRDKERDKIQKGFD